MSMCSVKFDDNQLKRRLNENTTNGNVKFKHHGNFKGITIQDRHKNKDTKPKLVIVTHCPSLLNSRTV